MRGGFQRRRQRALVRRIGGSVSCRVPVRDPVDVEQITELCAARGDHGRSPGPGSTPTDRPDSLLPEGEVAFLEPGVMAVGDERDGPGPADWRVAGGGWRNLYRPLTVHGASASSFLRSVAGTLASAWDGEWMDRRLGSSGRARWRVASPDDAPAGNACGATASGVWHPRGSALGSRPGRGGGRGGTSGRRVTVGVGGRCPLEGRCVGAVFEVRWGLRRWARVTGRSR
jgi:hypothetical protein